MTSQPGVAIVTHLIETASCGLLGKEYQPGDLEQGWDITWRSLGGGVWVKTLKWSYLKIGRTVRLRGLQVSRGSSPSKRRRRRGAQGLMRGARGPFLPASAMVGCCGDACCWPLETGNVSFFYSYVDSLWFLTCDTAAKKRDLGERFFTFRWFLCPTWGMYRTLDLNSPPPNWRQIHRDSWWANQCILWLQGLTSVI